MAYKSRINTFLILQSFTIIKGKCLWAKKCWANEGTPIGDARVPAFLIHIFVNKQHGVEK